jgi:hypothetical protein
LDHANRSDARSVEQDGAAVLLGRPAVPQAFAVRRRSAEYLSQKIGHAGRAAINAADAVGIYTRDFFFYVNQNY